MVKKKNESTKPHKLSLESVSEPSQPEVETAPQTKRIKKRELLEAQEKIEKLTEQPETGAIYVGHLPHGFIDESLEKYFNQFGPITRIICPRSSVSGRSVGYAFIEFSSEETARIAAKTMNNYILFNKILKCSFMEDKEKYLVPEVDIVVLSADPIIDSDPLKGPFIGNNPDNG